MLHPQRSLQDLVDGELSDRRRIAVERHVSRCSSCAAALERIRGLKSALLGLSRPQPHPDFQRRLLSSGSGGSPEPRGVTAGSSAAFVRDHDEQVGARRRRRPVLAAAGGSVVVAAAILASAYVVGSEARPVAAGSAAGTTALRSGWESVAPQTPTFLDTDQLETLRAGGWYCPELEALGFTLQSAEGITVGGRPTLELVLENDGDTVTVYEQRKVGGGAERRTAPVPLNAVTGNTVASDGFEHVGGTAQDVWVRAGVPWQAVLDSPSVTYTVVSDLPPASMPQTLSQLVTTEHAQLSLAPQGQEDSMVDRIIRGLSMITHPQDDAG
ncbi:anti-sigma factor family protein [Arthrobacter sp. L77]|uniref:anti-sigma factor family protein n=1 Tax=Arthrobacter sp. L77 TaxID=1496689 RepID=UPI0005BA18F0|nr:zf-HC2 domain-containing protein [Arthrobacter sp. L77]